MAYNIARYQRNFIRPTYEKRALPALQKIEAIQPQQAIQPIYGARSIDEQRNMYNKVKNETFLANYNDPTELNSFIDALTNRAAVSKEFGDTWGTLSTTSGQISVAAGVASAVVAAAAWIVSALTIDFGSVGAAGTAASAAITAAAKASTAGKIASALSTVSKIAAIPAVPAATKVAYDYGIKPITHGKPKEALLNTLMNFGETADAAANPVKGLVLEGGEGFVKATGLSDAGRYNYDYDTGFFLADMLLEVVSDPLNWTQWATTGVKRVATKAVVNKTMPVAARTVDTLFTVGKEQLPDLFKDIPEEAQTKILKKLNEALTETALDMAQQSVTNLSDKAKQAVLQKARKKLQRVLTRAIKKELPKITTDQLDLLLTATPQLLKENAQVSNALYQLTKNVDWDTLSVDVIKPLMALSHYAEAYEKQLVKYALMSTSYGITGWAVIKALQPIAKWRQSFLINKMKPFQSAPDTLNLAQYAAAKAEWQAVNQYTAVISNEAVSKNIDNFYKWNTMQFNRDKQLIENIMTDTTLDPLSRQRTLSKALIDSRKVSFDVYLQQLQEVNDLEKGAYQSFVDYAMQQKDILQKQIDALSANIKPTPTATINSMESLSKKQSKLYNKLLTQQAHKADNAQTLMDRVVSLKISNTHVNKVLLKNKTIRTVMADINSGRIGNLFTQILDDINARKLTANANILGNIQAIKEAAVCYSAVKNFYNSVDNMLLPVIDGLNPKQLREVIIDQITGMANRDISTLLSNFDGVTINELLQRINTLFYDYSIDFSRDMTFRQELTRVYKSFLQEQYNNNVLKVNAVLKDDLTKSITDLYAALPDYQIELADLINMNAEIYQVFKNRDNLNSILLQGILTDETSLFSVMSARGLTELGLAERIVAEKDAIEWFNLPVTNLSGQVVEAASNIGHKLNNIIKHVTQYQSVLENPNLNDLYHQFVKRFLEFNSNFNLPTEKALDINRVYWGSFSTTAFHYIKEANTPAEQLAQLIIFNQTQIGKSAGTQFNNFLSDYPDKSLTRLIRSPDKVMTTEWIQDQVNYSKVHPINEAYAHLVDAYDQITLEPDKLTRDFTTITDALEDTGFNMPQKITQLRHIKAIKNVAEDLKAFQKDYESLFDTELALELKEKYKTFLLEHPDFAQQRVNWSDAVEQAIKEGRDSLDNHPTHDEVLTQLMGYWEGYWKPTVVAEDIEKGIAAIDEFTPFVKLINEFNNDLHRYISDTNADAYDIFRRHFTDIAERRAVTLEDIKQTRKDNNTELYYDYVIKKENEKEVTKALIQERTEKLTAKLKRYNMWDKTRIKKEFNDKLAHLKLTKEYADMKWALHERSQELWKNTQFSKDKQKAYFAFKREQNKIRYAVEKELNEVEYKALSSLKKEFQKNIVDEYQASIEKLYRRCFSDKWKGHTKGQDPVIELYKRINKQLTGEASPAMPTGKGRQMLFSRMEYVIYQHVGRASKLDYARANKTIKASEQKIAHIKKMCAELEHTIKENPHTQTANKAQGKLNSLRKELEAEELIRETAIQNRKLSQVETDAQKAVSEYFNFIAALNNGLSGKKYNRKMRAWSKLELDHVDYKINMPTVTFKSEKQLLEDNEELVKALQLQGLTIDEIKAELTTPIHDIPTSVATITNTAKQLLQDQIKQVSWYEQEAREFALQLHDQYMDAYLAFKKEWSWDNVDNQFKYAADMERLRQAQERAYQNIFADYINIREFLYKTYIRDIQPGDDGLLTDVSMLGQQLNKNYEEFLDLVQAGQDARWSEFNKLNRKHINDYINTRYKDNDALRQLKLEALENYEVEFKAAYDAYVNSIIPHISAIDVFAPAHKQVELNSMIRQATDANARGTLYNIFNYNSTQLINHLATNSQFITFTSRSLNDKYIAHAFTALKERMKNEQAPIKFIEETLKDEQNEEFIRYWIYLTDTTVTASYGQYYINGQPIIRELTQPTFDEFQIIDNLLPSEHGQRITKMLNKLNKNVQQLTGATLNTSQGEYFTKDHLKHVYEFMPEEMRKDLPELEYLLDESFFNCHFNESVLGITKDKTDLGFFSSNMINNAKNAITGSGIYAKAKTEFTNLLLDSELSASKGIYKNLSDTDLCNALQQSPTTKMILPVHDKRYGMRIREIIPLSAEHIAKAREKGAIIVSLQTYKEMYGKINLRIGSIEELKWWSRLIYMYKTGYLMNPGSMIRNFIDTNFKTWMHTREEYMPYKAQAHKILDECDRIKDYVQRRSKDGLITRDAIKEYFDTGCAQYLTLEQFDELQQLYFSQGVSGNIMAELYQSNDVEYTLWNTWTNISGKVIDEGRIPYKKNEFGELVGPRLLPGNRTENYNRLAMYLYELDHGESVTSALAKLSKTHFDYSFKNRSEQILDLIFPFSTFMLRNYSYWIEMINKHPWIARNYIHLMKPSWDFQEYTPEELSRNRALQSQILNGHIKLGEYNGTQINFKLNPSIQNALTFMMNPTLAIYNNLAAPLESAVKVAQRKANVDTFINTIPVVGPMIQSAKKVITKGNPAPSILNTTKRYKFSNKNTNKINQFRDKQYRVPKYRNNVIFDSYKTIGTQRYRVNMYPVIDIAHEIKSRYTTNVYAKIKNRVTTDVYKGIRYRIKLDANRFR